MDLQQSPFFLTSEQCDWVAQTLLRMTPEEKIGQLFCVMGGDYAPKELERMVRQGKVGGILFRPVERGGVIAIRYAALDAAAPIPLLKAANLEEGGAGCRSDGTLFGWPMLTAATDDPKMARRFGQVCGAQAGEIGINWSFSPVCDLDLNYRNPITNVRTFGSDPQRVEAMTQAYVAGLQSQGVAACAKHFPGDGVDYRDQHLHPTVNSLPAQQWYETYGRIYSSLIQQGLPSIMVGHIAQPHVAWAEQPELSEAEAYMPASLSPTLLTNVLRGKLGFQGLITTDATIMGGYTMPMMRKQALARSIMAGCDMLVFSTNAAEDQQYLLQALHTGLLSSQRLDEAVTRILALKARVCHPNVPTPVPAQRWHQECADRAITLVKNTQPEKLPMTPERYPLIRLICLGKDTISDGSVRSIVRETLELRGFQVEDYCPEQDDLHGTSQLPENRLTLYVANYEQASNQTTIRIGWCPKHALDIPRFLQEETCVFVSLANPYHLQDVPRIKTYINAYTATRTTIRLVIDKLMGNSAFHGINPVDPFCGLPDTKL